MNMFFSEPRNRVKAAGNKLDKANVHFVSSSTLKFCWYFETQYKFKFYSPLSDRFLKFTGDAKTGVIEGENFLADLMKNFKVVKQEWK